MPAAAHIRLDLHWSAAEEAADVRVSGEVALRHGDESWEAQFTDADMDEVERALEDAQRALPKLAAALEDAGES